MEAFGCRKEKVLPRIEDRAKLWQQPDPRRWLVFALVGALVALSSVLFLSVEEAQAKAEGSPIQEPVEKATGGFDKPAQKATGETAGLAVGKEPRVKEAAQDVAAMGSTPQVDKSLLDNSAPVDAGPKPPPVVERVDRASKEVSRPVLEEAVKPADRSVPDEPTSVVSPALEEVTSAVEPVLREAEDPALLREATLAVEPIYGETMSATKPVLKEATPAIEPVLKRAASEIEPVLDGAAPTVEPVLEEVNLSVEPILKGIPSVVEPVLGSAGLAADLVGGVAEPVTSPLLEAASLAETVEPLSEKVVLPATVPVLGEALPPAGPGLTEAAPLAEPFSETAPPAVGPFSGTAVPDGEPVLTTTPVANFGEVGGPGNVELPAFAELAHYAPEVSPTISSHAPLVGVEAWDALPDPHLAPAALEDDRNSSFPGSISEVRPSAVGLSGSYFEPFGRSSLIDGHRAILSDAAVVKGSQDPKPRPVPFRFPSGMPSPAGSLLGGSGTGVALDLLGVLALFLILSRTGRSSWSSLGAFKPDSPLQLAVERPD